MSKHPNNSKPVYAIDFGTSNSLIGLANNNEIQPSLPIDPSSGDPTLFRSIIYFPNADQCYWGSNAIQKFVENDMEGRLLRSFKRFLPKKNFIGTYVENRPLNLEDIVAIFLKELKTRADTQLDQDVESVILGHPARFSLNDQDHNYGLYRLKRAAKEAGFKHIEFAPEPIAALTAFFKQYTDIRKVLCVDLGGGTSDFTIMDLPKGDFSEVKVLALQGIPVAGDAFDGDIMKHDLSPYFGANVKYQIPMSSHVLQMPKQLKSRLYSPAEICTMLRPDFKNFIGEVENCLLPSEEKTPLTRLKTLLEDNQGFLIFEAIEAAKVRLSKDPTTRFQYSYPDLEIDHELTQDYFYEYAQSTLGQITGTLEECIKQAECQAEDIDLVCLTGGTAQMPLVKKALLETFPSEKIHFFNHYHSVVEGLCHIAQEKLF